jgi:WD40 repeat protein
VEEDAQGRRLHRHLTQGASEWEAGARNAGELYQGSRLAAALEWIDGSGDDARLNRLEREFLEQSRAAHARGIRRLRALLALAVLLLLAAIVAGAIALVARGSARRQATAAIAQRLGAQALVEPRLDRALLLAREGVNLDDSPATRGNLLAALLKSPAAIAVLHGRGARVLDDALSRDGRTLAERSDDGSVTFFDRRTLRRVGLRFEGIGQISYFGAVVRPMRALAFSPDGRTLAVGDSDGHYATLSLVDARTHHIRAAVTAPLNAVTADVVFAPDGRTILTGEPVSGRSSPPAEVLVLRRASDAKEVRHSKPIRGGRLIGFAEGDRYLLETSGETTSYLLDPRTFRRVRTFRLSGAAALAPGGDVAAFGQDDGSVRLVDLRSGAVRPMERRATGRVRALAFSADGKTLATTSDDGSVVVWDVPTATLREIYKGHAAEAIGPIFSPDGGTLYTGSDDGSVIAWDVRGERRLGRPFRFAAPENATTAVAVSPDGSFFVTSPARNRVTLWHARERQVAGSLRGPFGSPDSFAWSHDGRLLAAAGDSRYTPVWDVATRKLVKVLGPANKGGAAGVNFSPDDKLVATAGGDGNMRVYDLRSGKLVVSQHVKGSLQDVDFSSDGKRVAAAGLGGIIAIWNVAQKRLERLIHHGPSFLSIRFSPDGKEIATGDFLGKVNFWDAATGREVRRPLGGQNGLVLSVTFNRSGTQLLTTSTDGNFRLWDIASERLVGAPLPGPDAGGWGTFFPDGKEVIAVFYSGMAVAWNVDPAAWKAQACRVAHRQLTRQEWHDFLPERPYGDVCG